MALIEVIAHLLIAITIGIMGAAIAQAHKLMAILEGSKAEIVWKRNLYMLYCLTGVYVLIMITRLFSPNIYPITNEGSFHSLIMNLAFLLAGILIYSMVSLEIDAFSSFFELLEIEDENIKN